MELSLPPSYQRHTSSLNPLIWRPRKKPFIRKKSTVLPCFCSSDVPSPPSTFHFRSSGKRWLMGSLISAATGICVSDIAGAVSTSRRALRGEKIPESDYTTLPNGLKYYDLKVGGGLKAIKGSRVAVHYVAKWRGVTFMTSRQGLGVSGGTPYGFDVGQSERGNVLKGLDLGVVGMRVGGQELLYAKFPTYQMSSLKRLLIVPPELAYGSQGVQEIPPNATIELDIELLAIKQSPFGSGVKLIEG